MKRCAFLTLENTDGWSIDDGLAVEPLRALGWDVDHVPWTREGVGWKSYAAVVIRSTWDYMSQAERFLSVLEQIEANAKLFNPVELVRWNLRKTYLRDLERRGVAVVPTAWRERLLAGELASLFDECDASDIVIKPVVGASASGAFRVDRRTMHVQAEVIEGLYADTAVMAQPFVPAITTEGEFSLMYFNGEYSHAILKTPKRGDFRVQEEHGGLITAVQPEAALLEAATVALRAIGPPPLYARADLVRHHDRFLLMELELIEPALYLRMDAGAAMRFARALDTRAG